MTTLVVIPTYNEAENLPAITAELFTLELPEELHILIVDDEALTREVVRRKLEEGGVKIAEAAMPGATSGSTTARNACSGVHP